MMIQFDIYFQWRRFLQNYEVVGYTEEQLSEYKRCFMAGSQQMFFLMNIDFKKLNERDKLSILKKLNNQFGEYWEQEFEKQYGMTLKEQIIYTENELKAFSVQSHFLEFDVAKWLEAILKSLQKLQELETN